MVIHCYTEVGLISGRREGGNSLLYRGRVDFRDGGRVVILCYTEVGLTSGMERG